MQEHLILPVTLPADRRHKRLALVVALLVPIPFIVIIPFGQTQLPRVDSYIPVVDTVILINDCITATLLLAQFSITRAPSLLALAAGFLFTAFLIVPHALTLPGAFAPDGLLGAGLQTPAWLNELWHLGLPTAVIAYALLTRGGDERPISPGAVRIAIFATVVLVFLLTCVLLWLTTTGTSLLSPIMVDLLHSDAPWVFAPPVALSIIAMMLLWPQRHLLLNLLLLIMLEIWMFDALLFYVLTTRYTLLWYGGRAFATFAASLVLLFLLSQTTVLYGRLARSHMLLERERDKRLMNARAITAAIAHEIRQPLAAISMNASAALLLLKRTPPDLDEVLDVLSSVKADSHRTNEMIDGLRTLFGQVGHALQPTDMNEIITDVLRSLHVELQGHAVAIRSELSAELPLVKGHKGQLREVVFNLVHNAIEAMETTTDRPRLLQVKTECRGRETIAATVQDSGPGIEPKQLNSIFDAFVTTKVKGMGLGLAICRMIIEHHGGQLTAASDGKNGALFQFVLPGEPRDIIAG